MRASKYLRWGCFAAVAMLSACGGRQNQQTMLHPVGPMSGRIESLWWFIFVIAVAVFVIVWIFLAGAAAKRKVQEQLPPDVYPDPSYEQKLLRRVMVATGITVIVLFAILGHSVITSKYMNSLQSKNPVSIQVYGHQWWWEVQYPNPDVSQWVTTANEIHVPVGVPVVLQTGSRDVIHSFWAPNIHGKRDLIPGQSSALWFQVDKEGTYRGQCAEFCGHQHAHMAFYIVAETPEKFQAWLEQQKKPAPEPSNDVLKHGKEVLEKGTCVMCHTVRGTNAGSRLGPDLTHVGSRLSIAAGTLPNNAGSLGGWISDPQAIKPGVRMPPNPMSSEDLQALVAYLQSLK
ncbi:MAG TPA: cytochrome c oxidase subunit II [Terriglobales bacterium]|nr:cytochrome c oxidase subunit II [Terriglobales bacterium]